MVISFLVRVVVLVARFVLFVVAYINIGSGFEDTDSRSALGNFLVQFLPFTLLFLAEVLLCHVRVRSTGTTGKYNHIVTTCDLVHLLFLKDNGRLG